MTEAEQERAAVVAWLRRYSAKAKRQADEALNPFKMSAGFGFAEALKRAADAFERGEHIKPTTQGAEE